MGGEVTESKKDNDPHVVDTIAEISEYDRSALVEEWQKLFGSTPAKNTSSSILIRIITNEVQCRTNGGLSSVSKRALRKELAASYRKPANHASTDRQVTPANHQTTQPPLLSAGTQLIREWNGRPYCVEVTDGGFMLDGKSYSSLSAIAKKITGAHWSGPRFFGLGTSKSKKAPVSIAGTAQ